MSLEPGTRLGHYEILERIGAGGMGEVYRSRDPRLGRDVAIKVSVAQFTERFDREARAVAALNHPNICTLHDVGSNFLVMEYVEGVTLSERISQGPVPLDEALRIARQIAEALEAAHEKGIVHRDLKPGNIKIRPDGSVKVLDFGLALVAQTEPRAVEHSPTISIAATQAGMILGTAAYMSPEQARGRTVDKRTDIWAFGVVLHEMLTGQLLFQGEDVTETLASVVKEQPTFEKIPTSIRRLVKKCLEKDPKKRLRDIGDVWELLEEPEAAVPPVPDGRASSVAKWGWAFAALFILTSAILAAVYFRQPSQTAPVLRYTLALPDGGQIQAFAISPNGRYLVMAVLVKGKRQLWLRALDALQAQPMSFTEDASYPFWSPNSDYIGFFSGTSLKKVAITGGPSQTLCAAPQGRGGTWNRDDVIVFSPSGNPSIALQHVSAGGGTPVDIGAFKGTLKNPVFLPDGKHFVYNVSAATPEKNGIYLSSVDGKENRRLLPDVSSAIYAPSPFDSNKGHLLFVREGTLMAQPFNAGSAQLAGDVAPLADNVSITQHGTYAPVSASDTGIVMYAAGGTAFGTQIALFDRTGKMIQSVSAPGSVRFPILSPNEKFVAFTKFAQSNSDIEIHDLARATDIRFTSDPSLNITPIWSPRSDRIVFASNRKSSFNLYQKAVSGTGPDELLFENENQKFPSQWSRDGRFVVYQELSPKMKRDIWVLPMGDTDSGKTSAKPIPAVQTEFEELFGQLSPDSHWIAYTSDLSGQNEVYVRPFPPAEGQWKISISGGMAPRWKGDGKELLFVSSDNKMMSAPVLMATPGSNPAFSVGTPTALFEVNIAHGSPDVLFEWDVTSDGKRFLVNAASNPGQPSSPLTVVVNWNSQSRK